MIGYDFDNLKNSHLYDHDDSVYTALILIILVYNENARLSKKQAEGNT